MISNNQLTEFTPDLHFHIIRFVNEKTKSKISEVNIRFYKLDQLFKLIKVNWKIDNDNLQKIVNRYPKLQKLDLRDCNSIAYQTIFHICQLTCLQELILAGASSITDLSPLLSLTNLKKLDFSQYQLSSISQFTHLQALTLRDSRVKNLTFLSTLTNLKKIEFIFVNIINPCFYGLNNLQELNFIACNITDLTLLSTLTNLKKLVLTNVTITNPCFYGPNNLQELDLSRSNIADLIFLSALTNLKKLNLAEFNTSIKNSNFSPLSQLNNLEELSFHNCDIKDLNPLSPLTNLTKLDLGSCKEITDQALHSIFQLHHLQCLDLSFCNIKAPYIGELNNLTTLNLSGCKNITDLSYLSSFTNLTNLNLSGCKNITDRKISFISQLYNLTNLNLSDCYIKDLSHLSKLINLKIIKTKC